MVEDGMFWESLSLPSKTDGKRSYIPKQVVFFTLEKAFLCLGTAV